MPIAKGIIYETGVYGKGPGSSNVYRNSVVLNESSIRYLGSNPLGESGWIAVALGFLVLESAVGSGSSTVGSRALDGSGQRY